MVIIWLKYLLKSKCIIRSRIDRHKIVPRPSVYSGTLTHKPMADHQISNEIIQRNFEDVNKRFNIQDETLSKILEQALKTNGRVGSLENWKAEWSGYFKALATFVIPVVMFLLYKQLS